MITLGTQEVLVELLNLETNYSGSFKITCIAAAEREVLSICVLPGISRQGIATALIMGLIRKSIMSGVADICLEVDKDDTPAIQLYERNWFEKIGEQKININ